MGNLPRMPHGSGISRTVQLQFGGLDRSPGAADGTLWDTKNLTTDELPLIAVRQQRKWLTPEGWAPDAMCVIDGKLLQVSSDGRIDIVTETVASVGYVEMPGNGEKCRLIPYGRDVILMPQKIRLRTSYGAWERFATWEALEEAHPNAQEGDAALVGTPNTLPNPCTVKIYVHNGEDWTDCGLFLETKELTLENKSVRFERKATAQGVETEDVLNLTGLPTTNPIEAGDALKLSGWEVEANNKTVIVRRATATEIAFYPETLKMPEYPARNGAMQAYKTGTQTKIQYACKLDGTMRTFTLEGNLMDTDALVYITNYDKQLTHYRNGAQYTTIETQALTDGGTYDELVTLGDVFEPTIYNDTVTIRRGMPDLENCFADENRLWGTKESELYGSKLGDPLNFDTFEGLSTDSYYLAVQTPGDFTAACSAYGYPTFFKTNYIYRLYGAKPDTYQLQELSASGVKQGCGESAAMANNTLMYLSSTGVMAYTGGYPERIDQALGNLELSDAIAGSDGRKYYLSAIENGGDRVLYIFDAEYGTWIREQAKNLTHFAAAEGCLLASERFQPKPTDPDDATDCVWVLAGQLPFAGGTQEPKVAALAEFGDITMQTMDRKSVHRVQLRLIVGTGATVTVAIRYDSTGDWVKIKTLTVQTKQSVYLPVMPRRCDHFRLRIAGTGEWKISGLALDLRQGSERF